MSEIMQERKPRKFQAQPAPVPMEMQRGSTGEEMIAAPSREIRMDDKDNHVLDQPSFSVLPIENHGMDFAQEWVPDMETPSYIGDTNMILNYLQHLERYHHVTMPIKACGIDPIVFSNVEFIEVEGYPRVINIQGPDAPQYPMQVPSEENAEGEESVAQPVEAAGQQLTPILYELIDVDGDTYLSCVSDCLDTQYMKSIIEEATSAVKSTGTYIFEMVGLRRLAIEKDQDHAQLLTTLKLNTYEMSVLISYMSQFRGMEVSHEVVNGKTAICFRVK